MKRLLTLLLGAFAVVACTQNEALEITVNRDEAPETLTIGFDGGNDTRIQLNEAQKTVWNEGDLVSVFYRSDANQKWQFQGETGNRIGNVKRVENAVGTTRTTKNVVVYPYSEDYWLNTDSYFIDAMLPAVQHYAVGSYGIGENLMVSQSEFTQFSLKNVCGWLKLQITGNGEKVQSIKLRGNNGEQVAGLIYVDTATAESTLAADMGSADDNNAGENTGGGAGGNLVFDDTIVTELTLDCGDGVELGAEATAFYIAVPPQTFEGGFSVEAECEGYEPMVISTENSLTIQRNHIQPMATVTFDAEEIVLCNEIRYTAWDKIVDEIEPWSFDTFGANILSHDYNYETGEGVITFDADVTTIGMCAFFNCYITSIAIPDSVTTIGTNAFIQCNNLTSITIPDSVTTFGNIVFLGCENLSEIRGKFASNDGRCLIIDGTLNSFAPAGLTEYTIPDSVTTIGYMAFSQCSNLTSITIPDSVTTIGDYAFSHCNSLSSVTIPDSVTSIGDNAFSGCDSITSVTIPDSVTTIGEFAFYSCDSLTSVTIGDSVTTIGDKAFAYCNNLSSVYISDSVMTIGAKVFTGCSGLQEFNGKFASEDGRCLIVDSALKVFAPAGLTEYTIPDSVTTIGDYAFSECNSLSSVTIPDSVTSIGDDTFSYCKSLSSVTIPDSVTTIGRYAFFCCYNLTDITIPDSVTTIGESAFSCCDSLTSVYCEAITPPSGGDNMFEYNASGRKIYVPMESVDAYKSAEYWSNYADAIVGYDFENNKVVE